MDKVFSYRIIKIGGKAVSVALTAFGLMVGSAQAAEVYLGSSLGQAAPDDGGTRTGGTWDPSDYWVNVYNPGASYSVSTSRSGDIFYGNTVTYSGTNGAAYNVYPWNVNPVTGWMNLFWDDSPSTSIDAQRTGTFQLNQFGSITDVNANNYNFGSGVTVGDVSRGSKAYAAGSYWTDGDDAAGGNGHWSITVYAGSAAGAQTTYAIDINGTARFNGNATVNGDSKASNFDVSGNNSIFNGSVTASSLVNVSGSDTTFNGAVTANQINLSGNNTSFAGNVTVSNGLNFLNAVTASMTGGADINGNINMGANGATLQLSDGSDVDGNITTDSSNSNSGTVIFAGNSTVNGHIGASTARLSQIDINGNNTRTVNLLGMNYVNLVNINTAGNLVIGDGHDTDGLDTTGTAGGRVDFNNTAGSVTLANRGTIRGQIVSTGGANGAGTPTVANEVNFSANGTMIGDIGSSASNRIGSVNVGTAAAGVVGMTGDLYANALNISSGSTLNITGDVTAASNLGTVGVNGSATLAVSQGDVTGAVTTANNGQGVFTLVGGTQTVTGNMGMAGMSLAAVNAGATAGTATLNGNVFATTLNVTGTGTVNLNGNFTGTSISYDAVAALGADGTVNLADGKTVTGAVSNDTGTAGHGVFTFVQNGSMAAGNDIGASATTSLKQVNIGAVAGTVAGTVTTDTIWATTTAINNNSTLHVRGGEHINGNVSTETHDTGTLTLVSGTQSVTGTVGALNMQVATVNAGANSATTTFAGDVFATQLNVTGTGTVNLNGHFTGTSISYDAVGAGGLDGTVNLANNRMVTGAVSNDTGTAGNGVFTFVQNGSMAAGHDIGSSTATSLKLVNVGAEAGSVAGTVTTDSIWATTTAINNGSTLHVRSGESIHGAVSTEAPNTSTLTMVGGTQEVTGNIGVSGTPLAVVNAGATGGNTTLGGNVFATHLNVTGTGTVNLNGHFTGTAISYDAVGASGVDGTVNLADGKIVTGAVSNDTGTAGNGVFTFVQNGSMAAGNDIGSSATTSLKQVNIGSVAGTVAGTVTTDTIWATTTAINNNSTLHVRGGEHINGNVSTETHDTGTLTLVSGNQTVTGQVGQQGASLATVNAGANGATTTLNGMVYATTLNFSGNGTTILNGTNGGSATGGLVGTVDFGTGGTGELQIGNGVKLTTGAAGIQFANANDAKLRFNGNSTVTGAIGAAATGATPANSTLGSIFAGVTDTTVTFKNDVHVSGSTFHVSGAGTVNLEGDLYGPLVYDADGTVNVSNGKSISNDGTAALGTVTTTVGNDVTGTLNYLGNTTLSNDLGTSGAALKAVNFHSDGTVAAVAQTLNKNVYAATTTIGNSTTGTTANVTANVYLGNSLTLAASNVTVNTAQQDVVQASAGTRIALANPNTLRFAYTPQNDGRLSTTATVTNAITGAGTITTNGATLNFTVASQGWAANAGGAMDASKASAIGGNAGSLTMNGNEKINIAMLGSLKNNETHTLINVGTATTATTGTATDNSYVIDSVLSRNASGDLVVTFSRDAQSYVTKSATSGHFSQAAATRLGTLAAAGTSYDTDMQRVINKLDLDQWGYGNNQANLAQQVKSLAPISNGSITLSALDAGSLALNTMGNRMASLRADNALIGVAGAEAEGRDGQWIKLVGNSSRQQAKGDFDGYSARTSGLVWGADTRLNPDSLLGLGVSATNTSVNQQDFRAGQGSTIRTYELAGYGAYQFNANVYGEASLSYANHNITGSRLTAIDRTAKADYDANQLTARIGLGYRHVLAEKQTLTPMVNLESSRLRSNAYNETGADALNLKFNAQTLTRNRASLGLRYLSENTTDAGTVFRPELSAEVYRDNNGQSHNTTAAFEGDLTGTTFTTTGVQTDRTGYKLSAGVSILNSKTSVVHLHYGYEHRDGFASHSARIKARWDF